MPRNVESLKFIMTQFQEIKKLYNVSEAETYLVGEMITLTKAVGHSPQLTLKLLKVVVAILEVSIEHWGIEDKNETN